MSFYNIKITECRDHDIYIIDVPANARLFTTKEGFINFRYNGRDRTIDLFLDIKQIIGRYSECYNNPEARKSILGQESLENFLIFIERNDQRGFIKKFNPLFVLTNKAKHQTNEEL